ncbi:MAG: DUF6470 family protein [Thermotaleaceae bacterium]
MDLRITTTPALIGIDRRPGGFDMKSPKADMTLNIEHAKVEIHTEQGQVRIDQSQCFSEAGLKNVFELTADNASFSKQKLMETIERIVRQGKEMRAIENKTDPIPFQAEENAFGWKQKSFAFDLIPKSRPKIDFVGGAVNIQVKEGKVNPQVQVNKPIVNYTPDKLDIYLRQKNSIQIEYIGTKFNQMAG